VLSLQFCPHRLLRHPQYVLISNAHSVLYNLNVISTWIWCQMTKFEHFLGVHCKPLMQTYIPMFFINRYKQFFLPWKRIYIFNFWVVCKGMSIYLELSACSIFFISF
jgi:hypothetical protein